MAGRVSIPPGRLLDPGPAVVSIFRRTTDVDGLSFRILHKKDECARLEMVGGGARVHECIDKENGETCARTVVQHFTNFKNEVNLME